jgi:hypothetical protein
MNGFARYRAMLPVLCPLVWALSATALSGRTAHAQVITEGFEDTAFEERGWYDNTAIEIDPIGATPESTHSAVFRYLEGEDEPTSGSAMRISFPPTRSVFVSYSVRYSPNWEGSNLDYHPHEFYLMTNVDGVFSPPATSHLTVYIEQNEGVPLLIFQDSLNIDVDRLREDLSTVTPERAAAGCNGSSDRYAPGDCYGEGRNWRNGKFFFADAPAFVDEPGPRYKADWHRVDAFIQLNTVTDGVADANGVMRYWVDNELMINVRDVVLQTGEHPDMRFNQFLIGPYMASSPVEQSFWIDDLVIDPTDRISTPISGEGDAGPSDGGGGGEVSGAADASASGNGGCAAGGQASSAGWLSALVGIAWCARRGAGLTPVPSRG